MVDAATKSGKLWSAEEEVKLLQGHRDYGPQWKVISEKIFMGSRSTDAIKRHYRDIMQRKQNGGVSSSNSQQCGSGNGGVSGGNLGGDEEETPPNVRRGVGKAKRPRPSQENNGGEDEDETAQRSGRRSGAGKARRPLCPLDGFPLKPNNASNTIAPPRVGVKSLISLKNSSKTCVALLTADPSGRPGPQLEDLYEVLSSRTGVLPLVLGKVHTEYGRVTRSGGRPLYDVVVVEVYPRNLSAQCERLRRLRFRIGPNPSILALGAGEEEAWDDDRNSESGVQSHVQLVFLPELSIAEDIADSVLRFALL